MFGYENIWGKIQWKENRQEKYKKRKLKKNKK